MLAPMLMKVLFVVLTICIAAVLVAVGALLWRLRWHLRRPHVATPEISSDAAPVAPPVEVAPEPSLLEKDVITK